MSRRFLQAVALYHAVLLTVIFGTDWTIEGAPDLWLYCVGVFGITVIEAALLAGSAAKSAVTQQGNWLTNLLRWPPDRYYAVAAWLVAKLIFLTFLLVWAMGWDAPMWATAVAVTIFGLGHSLFYAQWRGDDRRTLARGDLP